MAAEEGAASSNVVVRRQDGSTTRLVVWQQATVAELEAMIQQAEVCSTCVWRHSAPTATTSTHVCALAHT